MRLWSSFCPPTLPPSLILYRDDSFSQPRSVHITLKNMYLHAFSDSRKLLSVIIYTYPHMNILRKDYGHVGAPIIMFLVQDDVDTDSEDSNGRTPLSWARSSGEYVPTRERVDDIRD